MKRQSVRMVVLGYIAVLGLTAAAQAAPLFRGSPTTITIKMENENCANRIVASLREVPNVGEVRTDLAKKVAVVAPAGLRSPSARAVWEAVEKTGHGVVQLQGPQGTFTSKPEN
jgi:copper chaperone CopZ